MKSQTEIRVRYVEVDQMGVVHHSQYFVYMEIARTEMLRATGLTYRDVETSGAYLVITRAECRYRQPARYDDELVIETEIERSTFTRIDHRYAIRRKRDGTLLAEGETTLACVNREGELCRMPESLVARLRTG
ncbi:MAG: thioesterase family protein [Planctomycetota bacterium]